MKQFKSLKEMIGIFINYITYKYIYYLDNSLLIG
jgi:hypothetical protein